MRNGPRAGWDLVVRRADGQLLVLAETFTAPTGPTNRVCHRQKEVEFTKCDRWELDQALQDRIRRALESEEDASALPGGSVEGCMALLSAENPDLGFRTLIDEVQEDSL